RFRLPNGLKPRASSKSQGDFKSSRVRTPALNEYTSQRPSCLLESIERLYQSSFIFYTGPQSHYTQRKLGPKAPEWLESRTARLHLKEDMDEETRAEGKERQRTALQSFAKDFGRGVRQQRTRGKTKERAGALPLALSMFRRNASAHGEVDLLKEVQGSEGQTTVQDAAEEYEIIYSKGYVVALKYNYKRFIIPFFLAVLLKDLHHNAG
ncbi:unnamed protein product, partial [Porites lobata]